MKAICLTCGQHFGMEGQLEGYVEALKKDIANQAKKYDERIRELTKLLELASVDLSNKEKLKVIGERDRIMKGIDKPKLRKHLTKPSGRFNI